MLLRYAFVVNEATLFETRSDDDDLLIRAYQRQGRTLDDLPYTAEFEAVCAAVAQGDAPTRAESREAFHRLQNLRKSGRLPRIGKAAEMPVALDREHEQTLTRLVLEHIEQLGQRDRLPYTPAMDAIVERFNSEAGLSLTPHQVWRVIAKLAK